MPSNTPRLVVPKSSLLAALLFVSGCVVNVISYSSIEPVLASLLFLGLGIVLLQCMPGLAPEERRAFRIVFSVCWFWAGIAAIYADFFRDPGQTQLDAAVFYETLVNGTYADLGALETVLLVENGGVYLMWGKVYALCSALGFTQGRFIGILFNVFLVALTAVVGMRSVRVVYGEDPRRTKRFLVLYSYCGLFWLFASLHLRDSLALFAVSLLMLAWLVFLARPGIFLFFAVALASLTGFLVFGMIRKEFVFVPLAFLCAGLAAKFLGVTTRAAKRNLLIVAITVVFPLLIVLVAGMRSDIVGALTAGQETYTELGGSEAGESSVGVGFVGASAPVALAFGLVSEYMFPIPFWSGFLGNSAYHLFKSLNVVFIYFVLPLAGMAAWMIFRIRAWKRPPLVFLVFVLAGFSILIAMTSGESRHLGAFYVAFLVLACLPDLENQAEKRNYRLLSSIFLSLVTLGHAAWIVLKVFT